MRFHKDSTQIVSLDSKGGGSIKRSTLIGGDLDLINEMHKDKSTASHPQWEEVIFVLAEDGDKIGVCF